MAIIGGLLLLACSRSPLGPLSDGYDFCFEVEAGRTAQAELDLTVTVERADVFFLVDNSSSMEEEIDRIGAALETLIVPGIQRAVADTEFGLGLVADFSDLPDERAYRLIAPVGTPAGRVASMAREISLDGGGDKDEAQLEGLYQVATGAGLGDAIAPGPACDAGRGSGVCFRTDATRIVLLFTDEGMRGALTSAPWTAGTPRAIHKYPTLAMGTRVPYVRLFEETQQAVRDENIRVIGLWSGSPEAANRNDLSQVVQASGAIGQLGAPIVFDIGEAGETLDRDVVESVRELSQAVRPNVYLRIEGVGEVPEGLVGEIGASAIAPETGGRVAPDGRHFISVVPGSRVSFVIALDARSFPTDGPHQRFQLRAVLEDEAGARLGGADIRVSVVNKGGQGGC